MELEKKRTGVELKFFDLTSKIVSGFGHVLYDLEYIQGSSTLRVFIMNPETKTAVIEDCVEVDKAFDEYCESESWIPEDFTLEVSSPGVYRSLKTLNHFEAVTGEMILVGISGNLPEDQLSKLPKALKNQKKIRGKLKTLTSENITIEINDVEVELDFSQIKKATLDPDF